MENIMWEAVEFIFAGVSTVLTYLFIQAFLKNSRKVSIVIKLPVILAVVAVKFFTSHFFMDNTIVISCISVISAFSIGIVFFKSKIYGIGAAALFSTASGTILELIASFFITTLQEVPIAELHYLNIYRLQGRTLSSLLFLLLIILVSRFRATAISTLSTKSMLTLCTLPIASIFVVQQFIIHIIARAHVPTISEIVSLVSIMLVNIFIFVMMEHIIRQNERNRQLALIKIQNEAYQRYIKQLMSNQLQIRKMHHDFRQQVQGLYTLCIEERYDALLSELSKLSNRCSKTLLVDTGNIMLDSILTSKMEIAESQNIELKKLFKIQADLKYINSEICVLLGNALDNAIEACMRSVDSKFIGIELTATSNQFLCHIINSVGVAPKLDGEIIKTSKSDILRHGIGLHSMRQTCINLGGDINYKYDDKYFNLWIKLKV